MTDTKGKAPDWTPFFSPGEWGLFVAAVGDDLDARALVHRIDAESGCVHVDLPARTRVPNVLGLQSIAQVCHTRPRDAWAAAIKHHFDVAFDAKDGDAADALAKDWSLAKRVVKLRLYLEEHLPEAPVVTFPVAEGLVAVLSFDLPDTVITVRREDRAGWPVDDADLYRAALENVRVDGALPRSTVTVGGDTTLHLIESASCFFTATHALLLDEYLGAEGTSRGAVVSIPHRHVVLYHPIVDLRVVRAIQTMIGSTLRMYAEGPGSISPDLYWWRPGRSLLRLPFEQEGDAIRFEPPAELAAILDSLSAPHADN